MERGLGGMMDTVDKLGLLSAYRDDVEKLALEKKELIASILPDEIKKQLDDIEAEFNNRETAVSMAIESLESEIKQDVLYVGTTIKGKFLMAVWNKARETVDMKQLKGYAVAHPEVNSMIKTGEPTCTIRKNGKGE